MRFPTGSSRRGDALIGDGIAQVEERIRTVLQTAEQELLTDSTKE